MVVNINQVASLFDETLHALKYSAIAKQVVVVQEPEPTKPVTRNRPLDSVLEEQNRLSRMTVGWASPGESSLSLDTFLTTCVWVYNCIDRLSATIANVLDEEEKATKLALPLDEDESDEEVGFTLVHSNRLKRSLATTQSEICLLCHFRTKLISSRRCSSNSLKRNGALGGWPLKIFAAFYF